MTVRITSGEFRGRKIGSVPGLSARPTSASVRNAVFNILGDKIINASVADLFCAGGTLGIEALSHGARSCCFVENGFKSLRVLRENIENIGIQERCHILSMNALMSMKTMMENNEKFDVLFADPPYRKPLALPLIKNIENSGILNDKAVMVLEISSRDEIKFPSSIKILKSRVSGDTAVYFISFDRS